jgi:hypothetical protein
MECQQTMKSASSIGMRLSSQFPLKDNIPRYTTPPSILKAESDDAAGTITDRERLNAWRCQVPLTPWGDHHANLAPQLHSSPRPRESEAASRTEGGAVLGLLSTPLPVLSVNNWAMDYCVPSELTGLLQFYLNVERGRR